MGDILRKRKLLILSSFFILIVVLLSVVSMMTVNKYRGDLILKDAQIYKLENTLLNIGELKPGFVTVQAVRAGEQIKYEHVQEVDVPVKLGLNTVSTWSDIENKYFRTSLEAGTVLTGSNLLERRLGRTYRYFDVVLDDIPIGLAVGDFIDIRITFPFGEDFIAIARKQVIEINSGVLKLILNESEIYAYQSMLVDKAIYPGTRIYAVKYVDPGAQPTAEVTYPLNRNLAELSAMNPNLVELVKQEMIVRRTQINNLMGGNIEDKESRELEIIRGQLERIREGIGRDISQSQSELERRLEQERVNAELQAQ